MFDFIRTHSKLMLALIVLLIIPSFVFFGIEGYSRMNDGANAAVAEGGRAEDHPGRVGSGAPALGREHAPAPARHRRRDARHPGLQARDAGRAGARACAARGGRRPAPDPGDERLPRAVRQRSAVRAAAQPRRQRQPRPAGRAGHELGDCSRAACAATIGMQQVLAGVGARRWPRRRSPRSALDALLQQREVQVQRFDAAAYRGRIQPTEAELEAYHKAHAEDVPRPRAGADRVRDAGPGDTCPRTSSVPEDDLKRYYEQNASRYTAAEERRASHILIKADKEMPAAEREKAKAKAEALLAEVRAKPASFAEVAKTDSARHRLGRAGRRPRLLRPRRDGQALRGRRVRDEAGRDQPGDRDRFRLPHHPARRRARRREAALRDGAWRDRGRGAPLAGAAQVRRSGRAVHQHGLRAVRQPAAGDRQVQARQAQRHACSASRRQAPTARWPRPSCSRRCSANDALRNKRNTDAVEVGPSQLVSARVVKHEPERVLPLADVPAPGARTPDRRTGRGARPQGRHRRAWPRCAAPRTPPPNCRPR